MTTWIDTHCHLDAADFGVETQAVRASAARLGVAHCVIPTVHTANFDAVRLLAEACDDSYALGIHPLYTQHALDTDLDFLDAQLTLHRDDPRLVAVGEIGLDLWAPELTQSPWRERQMDFYLAQLKLAKQHALPVILHVRRSADLLLKGLRSVGGGHRWQGIAHAFNGSDQQAHAFIGLGFKLGFGGAFTYERAQQLRRLARTLPLDAIVMETDSPDMPPHWIYKTAAQREASQPQGRNEPAELPRIGAELAALRSISVEELAAATSRNAMDALPRLGKLLH